MVNERNNSIPSSYSSMNANSHDHHKCNSVHVLKLDAKRLCVISRSIFLLESSSVNVNWNLHWVKFVYKLARWSSMTFIANKNCGLKDLAMANVRATQWSTVYFWDAGECLKERFIVHAITVEPKLANIALLPSLSHISTSTLKHRIVSKSWWEENNSAKSSRFNDVLQNVWWISAHLY